MIELGYVRGDHELAMQVDRLRHEDIVERQRHGRTDWVIAEPLIRSYLAARL
jgi:hypothetical protein